MSRLLFSSLFLFSSVKFHMQDIHGKLFGLAFLCTFSFLIWTSDEEVMSFFLYCAPHIHACFFFPHIFLYFCLLLKNASNIIFIIIYCKVQSFDLLFIKNYLGQMKKYFCYQKSWLHNTSLFELLFYFFWRVVSHYVLEISRHPPPPNLHILRYVPMIFICYCLFFLKLEV